jgi:hypothetical protein
LRREISVFQERIRNIETGQAPFEERVTCAVDTQLRNMSSMVEQQTRNLREDLSRNIETGQAAFEERVTRNLREYLSRNIEATKQDFETQLSALKLEAAKTATWPTARLREVTRVPTGRPSTPPECRRSKRPVCWWCGQPGHIQKYCRQRPAEEMSQDPRTRMGVFDSPIKSPRYAVKVLAEWAKGSLISDIWLQEKPCRVTIDTGASATVARPDIVADLPEREQSQPCVLQTASGEKMPVVREAHV